MDLESLRGLNKNIKKLSEQSEKNENEQLTSDKKTCYSKINEKLIESKSKSVSSKQKHIFLRKYFKCASIIALLAICFISGYILYSEFAAQPQYVPSPKRLNVDQGKTKNAIAFISNLIVYSSRYNINDFLSDNFPKSKDKEVKDLLSRLSQIEYQLNCTESKQKDEGDGDFTINLSTPQGSLNFEIQLLVNQQFRINNIERLN